jgi:protein-tyrosine phosphatase
MGVVDFHNHLMPAVDDGAQTAAEALEALIAFKNDGVSAVVATPHLDASTTVASGFYQARLKEFDVAHEELQRCAKEVGDVRVERGVELRLDVPEPDLSDPRVRLGGGKFFLMEFPSMTVPPQSAHAIQRIVQSGYRPIIAHPERYGSIGSQLNVVADWKEQGALLQVNGGSLLGRYGSEARDAAFELLGRGWIDYLSSDYHARGPTLVAQYRELLEKSDASEQAHTLMETNPGRMLDGVGPIPVAPLRRKKRTLWHRVAAILNDKA